MADMERDEEGGAHAGRIQQLPATPRREPDIHNFSTSSSHRLVTISGTQALQNERRRARGITTGLPSLDVSLVPTGSSLPSSGIRPGYVTEICGPPGVGKTTFGMQLAANVLHSSELDTKVVWLNTGSPVVYSRLKSIVTSSTLPPGSELPSSPPRIYSSDALLSCFHYHELTSLPHLLTLIMHPTPLFPPPQTALLIIDDLSNLIFSSLPQPNLTSASSTPLASTLSKRESARRIQTVESISSSLSSLAASRHIAIVLLNKCTTTQKPGSQAMLKSALAGQAWDPGVNARIILYRAFPPWDMKDKLSEQEQRGYRLAEVVRLGNKDVVRNGVPYVIEAGGMREISISVTSDGDKAPPAVEAQDRGKGTNEQQLNLVVSPVTMPLSDPPPPLDDEGQGQGEEEQLVDRGEPESENLGPGLEDEDDNALFPPSTTEAKISLGKRKAIEIADSEDEDEDDDEGETHSGSEPELPRILSAREMHDGESQDGEKEEMLLDEHERLIQAGSD